MNSNPIFIYKNYIDESDTVLTSSSEVATLPKENMLDYRLAKKWRTTGLTGQYFRAALGKKQYIDLIILLAHNLSGDATVTVKVFSDAGFTTEVYSLTKNAWEMLYGAGTIGAGLDGAGGAASDEKMKNRTNIVFIQIPQTHEKYWEVSFSDAGNLDGYFEIGRPFLSSFLQLAYGFDFNGEEKYEDPSKKSISELGIKDVVPIKSWAERTYPFNWLLDGEQIELLDLQRDNGKKIPFMFFSNPDKTVSQDWFFNFMYCTMKSITNFIKLGPNRYSLKLTLEEY